MNIRKYVAEFLGTLTLVLFACGTAAIVGCTTPAGYATVAVAFGLVIVAMAYSVGNVSGCHINPAVSFAMLLSGRMSKKDFVGYIVAQLLGGIAGAAPAPAGEGLRLWRERSAAAHFVQPQARLCFRGHSDDGVCLRHSRRYLKEAV